MSLLKSALLQVELLFQLLPLRCVPKADHLWLVLFGTCRLLQTEHWVHAFSSRPGSINGHHVEKDSPPQQQVIFSYLLLLLFSQTFCTKLSTSPTSNWSRSLWIPLYRVVSQNTSCPAVGASYYALYFSFQSGSKKGTIWSRCQHVLTFSSHLIYL